MAFASKFQGTCARCGKTIYIGDKITWDRSQARGKRTWHADCNDPKLEGKAKAEPQAGQGDAPMPGEPEQQSPDKHDNQSPEPQPGKGDGQPKSGNAPDGLAGQVAEAIMPYMQANFEQKGKAVDERKLVKLIEQHAVRRVEIERPAVGDVPAQVIDMGLQHFKFDILLKTCQARVNGARINVWLVGPAGTSKTTSAKNVGKAMGLERIVVLPKLSESYTFFGYHSPGSGEYVRTPARDVWEHGGMLVMDDFDGTDPNVATELNAPLANGDCMFPDGMVPRHPDCLIILTANTWGLGATIEYVGRLKQDAAFMDRFVCMHWPIDENMERAITGHDKWVDRVQAVRRKVAERGIKVLITPRRSLFGASLLNAGLDWDTVEEMVLKGAMTPDQWEAVC